MIEATVLSEADWQPLFDEIWLVVAPRGIVARVDNSGRKQAETEARIKVRLSDDERRKWASIVIENARTIRIARPFAKLWAVALQRNAAAPKT